MRPIPKHLVIDWRRFFDFPGGPAPQRAHRIDGLLSSPVLTMPNSVVPPPDPRVSLPERNLIRGKRGLPSGQDTCSPTQAHDPCFPNAWKPSAPRLVDVFVFRETEGEREEVALVGAATSAEQNAAVVLLEPVQLACPGLGVVGLDP